MGAAGEGAQPSSLAPPLPPTLTSLPPTQDTPADPEGPRSVSDEDGDYTWTPSRQFSTLASARRKARKGRAGRGPVKPKNDKAPCSTQMKKKCVNGFIMFCRMNRKQYIRWVAPSAATPCPRSHLGPCIGQGLPTGSSETPLRLK